MTHLVIDLSHFNDVRDFAAVRKSGVVAIFHKLGQGETSTDQRFVAHRRQALEAGLLFGAYWFIDAGPQAPAVDKFLSIANLDEFPRTELALDWESDRGRTASLSQALEFMQLVEQKTGRRMVLYSGNTAIEALNRHNGHHVNPDFAKYRLWIPRYGHRPVLHPTWSQWWLWQDSATGAIPGIHGHIDTNVFHADEATLRAEWAVPPPPAAAPAVA
jgi:GH25 family lysozyme M1 (1,4-beta-N-acetylmuramidase)